MRTGVLSFSHSLYLFEILSFILAIASIGTESTIEELSTNAIVQRKVEAFDDEQ